MDPTPHLDHAARFADLHRPGDPLILVNAWDVASAQAIAKACPAVATSSGAVSAARGHADGQTMPLAEVVDLTARIALAIDKPLSVDFEAGYSDDPDVAAENALRLAQAGAVGVNLEDGFWTGTRRLADPAAHAAKISAIRAAVMTAKLPLFLNARIDTWWLGRGADPEALLAETERRAGLYVEAGADGVFVPLLDDPATIARLATRLPVPLNVMVHPGAAPLSDLISAGVARISLATWPMLAMMEGLRQLAETTLRERRYPEALRPRA